MENFVPDANHLLSIDNRKKLTVTGVTDTSNFDEETLLFDTNAGRVEVKGENLHVTRLNLQTGEMEVEGNISSVTYYSSPVKGKSFFRKVFA